MAAAAPRRKEQHLDQAQHDDASVGGASTSVVPASQAKKDKIKKKRGPSSAEFRRQIWTLLRIAMPTLFSRGSRLFAAQFCLLVMRTLVTLRCSKLCVYFLTRAIAQGSWKYWVRWLVNFCGWTAGATSCTRRQSS